MDYQTLRLVGIHGVDKYWTLSKSAFGSFWQISVVLIVFCIYEHLTCRVPDWDLRTAKPTVKGMIHQQAICLRYSPTSRVQLMT